MQRFVRGFWGLVGCVGLMLGTTGCIKQMILDGQIASTRKAGVAVNTIGDWEVAMRAAYAGMAQFEGMHYLAPDNEDGLFLLTKGWSGVAFGFIEDDLERAELEHGDMSEHYEYHKARAVAAYARAIFYGSELLESLNPGFEDAQRNAKTIRAWLAKFDDPEHAPYIFWTAHAMLGRTNLLKDQPEVVSELFIAYELVKHAVKLDETYMDGSGHVILGAYHARSRMAELEDSKKHFEKAIEISGGRALLAKYNFAARYYCAKMDKANYVRLLNEVLEAGDINPTGRLQNTIAKRRAKRALSAEKMEQCGFE